MPRKKTHKEYENQLLDLEIDYLPIEAYKGSKDLILHECVKEHKFLAKPEHILDRRGCPICSINLKTHEQYELDLIKKRISYKPVDSYIRNDIKIRHICNACNHIWLVSPNAILKGNGCPKCSKTSFKKDQPAKLYLISFTYKNDIVYKLGITNKKDIRKRYIGEWNSLNMNLIWELDFTLGEEASNLEKLLKTKYHEYCINTGQLKRGNTETFNVAITKPVIL